MTQPGTKPSKEDLRARMRRVRASIPPEERRGRSARVTSSVLALTEVAGAGTALLFWSFGTEIHTDELVHTLQERGVRVLLPYLEGDRMEASPFEAGDAMVDSGYGAKEPAHRMPVDPREIDVVIAPGLAFDRRGHRLGYGAGYYDRFLARLDPAATRVGIGFAEQLLDRIPRVPHDQRLDVIVTDAEVVVVEDRTGRRSRPL